MTAATKRVRRAKAVAPSTVHDRQLNYQAYEDFMRRRELKSLAPQLRMLERLMPAARAADAEIYGGEVKGAVWGRGIRIDESYAANRERRAGASRNEVLARVFCEQGMREVERRATDGARYWVVLVKGHLRVTMHVCPARYSEKGVVYL
ncbi:hypothetical protein B2J88_11860 [Rhodococcus sp. SRB_17]|uniref:hypothetical protein n=1 Tax=Acidovorax sp. SRB_24 TaxID=1962700 RepID=UPI00145D8199|nr:hypothetical protein [Acidovorax sp. SRB_24]NMM75536.1 hypothetical protein [Acidovorax sp. SRB_24]NMM85055.1 hypothetical protein [Rhodococcus sp. SRB_17]